MQAVHRKKLMTGRDPQTQSGTHWPGREGARNLDMRVDDVVHIFLPSLTWTFAPEICLEKQAKHLLKKICAFMKQRAKFSRGSQSDLKTSTGTNSHSQEMEAANQSIRSNND
jgi:hypothetical protein